MFDFAGFSAVFDLDIHLRYSLLRVLSRINVSNLIGWGSEIVKESLADFLSLVISAQAAEVFFPPYHLGVLGSCVRIALFLRSLMADFFGFLLVPKGFPVFFGLQNYRSDCTSCLREIS